MKSLATIPIACLFLMLPALPAAAAHPERARRPVQTLPHAEGFAHELQRAASELQLQTGRLLEQAMRNKHHRSRSERKALKRLKRLHRQAHHFRSSAQENRRIRHLARDFHQLERRYKSAAGRFHRLHPSRRMQHGFNHVTRLIGRIEGDLEQARWARYDRPRRQHRWNLAWR